jgi:hypothetical protein
VDSDSNDCPRQAGDNWLWLRKGDVDIGDMNFRLVAVYSHVVNLFSQKKVFVGIHVIYPHFGCKIHFCSASSTLPE